MNKQEYLNKLEELLKADNIENSDSIIEEASQKFDIGSMAGLSDDEIIADLGSPEEIVRKNKKVHRDNKVLDIEIADPFSSDIIIHERSENGIDIRLSRELKDKLNVIINDDKISIKPFNKLNHYRNLRSCEINVEYGPNITFNNVSLHTVSGDGDIDNIKCRNANIETVSGDFDIDSLEAESVVLKTVSGDIDIDDLKTNVCTITTVSGDVDTSSCSIKSLVATTISGDIDITGLVNSSKCSKISGDITINHEDE